MTSLVDALRPPDQQDEFTAWMLTSVEKDGGGYVGAKKLADGTYAGVLRLAFTYGLCLGVDKQTCATRRFCFEHIYDCLHAFNKLTSIHDDPIGWVASRPKLEEWDCQPIATAPQDGTVVRVTHFAFGHCNYCRSAVYLDGWVEIDSSRDGQPIEPTHWLPDPHCNEAIYLH